MYDFMSYLNETADKKNPLPPIATSMIQSPTGFMYMDYGAGSYLNVLDENEIPMFTYHNIGITQGSVNVLISKSQGGKTTLAMRMAAAIIESYINPFLQSKSRATLEKAYGKKLPEAGAYPIIQILDTEKTLPIDYAKKIMQYTNKQTSRHVMINPISTDRDLINILVKHADYKKQHMNKIVHPMLNIFGKPIIDYPPTVLIIDSMSNLILEEYDDLSQETYGKMTQNTAGAKRARIISALYSQLVNYAKLYNITIFSINHINKMPPMNGIPVKQYRGLRAGETIGGGERAIYLAANILRLDVIKSINTVSSNAVNLGDDVNGFITISKWIKSKSNSKMNESQLIYISDFGYDPFMSNVWNAKERSDLLKSGNFFYLPGFEKNRFTMKNAKEVFSDNPSMISTLYDTIRDKCANMLDNQENALMQNRKLMESVREDIHKEYGYDKSAVNDMDDMFASLINS